MYGWMGIAGLVQLFFAVIIGLYFWNLLKNQRGSKVAINRESSREMDELQRLRSLSLTEPLAEKVRPSSFKDYRTGYGFKALRCDLRSQSLHVLLYGPPGVGKQQQPVLF